jgi:hypothetical protein
MYCKLPSCLLQLDRRIDDAFQDATEADQHERMCHRLPATGRRELAAPQQRIEMCPRRRR